MADITQGLRGLTFERALAPNPRRAARLDNLRDEGFVDYGNEPETRFRQYMKDADAEGELLSQMVNWRPSRNQRMLSQEQGFLGFGAEENIGLVQFFYSKYFLPSHLFFHKFLLKNIAMQILLDL